MPHDFHLLALPLLDEPAILEHALEALSEVEEGETAFLSEALAWTPLGSGVAYARLLGCARKQHINIVTTLNLGCDLTEDLPGRLPEGRYHALTIFTRHGAVHVPQAKIAPHSFETDEDPLGPGMGVLPYGRLNRVRLDIDEQLLDVRFLIGTDLLALTRSSPAELRCDLLVAPGNLPREAEQAATRLLERALESRAALTALQVNGYQPPRRGKRAIALKVERVLDGKKTGNPRKTWKHPRTIRSAFHLYEGEAAPDFSALARLPANGRIAVERGAWERPTQLGEYPVTVVM
jgi:hypothetical protein